MVLPKNSCDRVLLLCLDATMTSAPEDPAKRLMAPPIADRLSSSQPMTCTYNTRGDSSHKLLSSAGTLCMFACTATCTCARAKSAACPAQMHLTLAFLTPALSHMGTSSSLRKAVEPSICRRQAHALDGLLDVVTKPAPSSQGPRQVVAPRVYRCRRHGAHSIHLAWPEMHNQYCTSNRTCGKQ